MFDSINQVRGLGLLLYGLLRRSFEGPWVWNGPGQRDVLSMFFFSSRRRHTSCRSDWSSDVCSSDLETLRRPKLPVRPPSGPRQPSWPPAVRIPDRKNVVEGKRVDLRVRRARGKQ